MTDDSHQATCPHCGSLNEATATDGTEGPPPPGSVCFCMACGGLAIYEDDYKQRVVTPDEEEKYGSEAEIVRARKMLSYTSDPRLASSFLAMTP
jgi:hypothetical protein